MLPLGLVAKKPAGPGPLLAQSCDVLHSAAATSLLLFLSVISLSLAAEPKTKTDKEKNEIGFKNAFDATRQLFSRYLMLLTFRGSAVGNNNGDNESGCCLLCPASDSVFSWTSGTSGQ